MDQATFQFLEVVTVYQIGGSCGQPLVVALPQTLGASLSWRKPSIRMLGRKLL